MSLKQKRMSKYSKDLVGDNFEPEHEIKWWLVAGIIAIAFIMGIFYFNK